LSSTPVQYTSSPEEYEEEEIPEEEESPEELYISSPEEEEEEEFVESPELTEAPISLAPVTSIAPLNFAFNRLSIAQPLQQNLPVIAGATVSSVVPGYVPTIVAAAPVLQRFGVPVPSTPSPVPPVLQRFGVPVPSTPSPVTPVSSAGSLPAGFDISRLSSGRNVKASNTYTVQEMKDIARSLGLTTSGTKQVLYDRIMSSLRAKGLA
jgi:hypothetical protein